MNNQELQQAWEQVCNTIRESGVSVGSFDAFISRLTPQAMSSTYLMLTADTAFVKQWIERTYKQHILMALKQIYGVDFIVDVEVDETQPAPVAPQPIQEAPRPVQPQPAPAPVQPQPLAAPAAPAPQPAQTTQRADDFASSERFNNFVIGDSNNIAYELAVQVATQPGKTRANPLFIYGKSGLGKTHLLRAIKNEIEETIPGYVARYTDATDMISHLSDASRDHSVNKDSYKSFRDYYTDVDVLLIDDVQMLSNRGKGETLNNVFQFLNQFKSAGKQIVLAADRAPRNIDIDQRYTSRFAEGIVQDISTPSVETKLAIIKNCLEENREITGSSFDLPEEVQAHIAEISSSNIRELKGAISSIIFNYEYSNQDWTTITVDQVDKLLQDSFSGGSYKRLTAADIQREVADFYKVSPNDLVSSKRSRPIAHARQVAIYLCHKMLGLTQSDIGKLFGGRDHSTIMYSQTQVAAKLKEDYTFKEEVDLLTQIIREA